MSLRTSWVRDESGVAAILIALCMLVLLGFAAIAVDSGLKFDERRQEQGGVDAGTLSAGIGAQMDPVQAGCETFADIDRAVCNGAVVAMDIINKNADAAYPMAAFDNATLCADAVFPAEFLPGGNKGRISRVVDGAASRTLECIRWNENMSKVRVILPITAVNTTFGRVLGVNTMNVNAFAEAETSLKRPGQLIPFAVGPTGGAANLGCLYEPPAGQTFPPCDGPEEGNFGYMRPYLYGDVVMGTTKRCNAHADNIAASFAKGADHIYALNASVPGTANDRDNCPNKNQLIDEIDVTTGGSGNAVSQGGLGAIFGTEGRLLCKDGDSAEPTWISPTLSSASCEAVNNGLPETVDNTPLFSFINSGAAAESAGACHGGISNKAALEGCLAAWRAFGTHSRSLFTAALATSPRFAWIPRVNKDPSTGGSGFYTIEEFLPVYIQTLYLKCDASVPSCDVVFDPGEPSTGVCAGTALPCGFPSTGNKTLDAMSAFILRTSMLPFPLDQFPGAPGGLLYNLSE